MSWRDYVAKTQKVVSLQFEGHFREDREDWLESMSFDHYEFLVQAMESAVGENWREIYDENEGWIPGYDHRLIDWIFCYENTIQLRNKEGDNKRFLNIEEEEE